MLQALRTRRPAFVQKTILTDWRLRFSSITDIRLIFGELTEFTRSNDQGCVKLAIEVLGHLIGFDGVHHSDEALLAELCEQITILLLQFVRSNEAEKAIILDSVFLVRRLVQLYPERQFAAIQRVSATHERSVTLLIAVAALIPHLLAFNVAANPVNGAMVVQFANQIQAKLSINDWLSPLTNGFLGFYDAGSRIQLLDTNKYFDEELNDYLLKITGQDCKLFVKPPQKQPEYTSQPAIMKQIKPHIAVFNQILQPIKQLADSCNIEALQVIAAAATVDETTAVLLEKYLQTAAASKQMTPALYEQLFEIIAYFLQKCSFSPELCKNQEKTFVDIVLVFQQLLRSEQLNQATFQTQIHIARIFGLLCKLRKHVQVTYAFLRELLVFLIQTVQNLLLSRDSPAFAKIQSQLKQNEGICGERAVYAWQPPASPSKQIRTLFLQIIQAADFLVSNELIDCLEVSDQLIVLLQEYRVCSNISIFRYLAGHVTDKLVQRTPSQRGVLISNLQSAGSQDPQWRNRLQFFVQQQKTNPKLYIGKIVEAFEFPFQLCGQAGIDVPHALGDQRAHVGTLYQQLCDQVHEVRSQAVRYLFSKMCTVFAVTYEPVAKAIDYQYVTKTAKGLQQQFQSANTKVGSGTITAIEQELQVIFSILSVLQYADSEYLKESCQQLAFYGVCTLSVLAIAGSGEQQKRASEDLERVSACLKAVLL